MNQMTAVVVTYIETAKQRYAPLTSRNISNRLIVLGYDPDRITRSTFLHHLASGTLGGIVTRAVISPFDVVKIRFQLQSEAGHARVYTGLIQATRLIFKNEGIKAFWKGHVPAQMLSMVYGGVQFCSFEFFTVVVHRFIPHSKHDTMKQTTTHGVCGSLSAAVATVVAQPLDVLRTRFAAQTEPKLFRSSFRATMHMIECEGYCSLYRGLVPSLIQIVPFSAIQFGSRSVFEAVWLSYGFKEGKVSEFACGGAAGLFAKTLVYPLDVVKKRLQIQGFSAPTVSRIQNYKSFIHCSQTIWHHEGARAFFKGYKAAALKSTMTSGLVFATYRFFREVLEPHRRAFR